jgi:hypothetical protein
MAAAPDLVRLAWPVIAPENMAGDALLTVRVAGSVERMPLAVPLIVVRPATLWF